MATARAQSLFFSNMASHALAGRIARAAGMRLGKARIGRFADGEIDIEIQESLRGRRIVVVGSTQPPADNLLELVLLCKAARSLSPKRITLVIPYLGYNRQDKPAPGKPHAARAVFDILHACADEIIVLDLHTTLSGVRQLNAASLAARHFMRRAKDLEVVSPDAGGKARADLCARLLDKSNAIVFKKTRAKTSAPKISAVNARKRLAGKDVLIFDDLLDSGGTLAAAARAAKAAGAKNIYAFATHGLFSGAALAKLSKSPLREIVVTDSIAPKAKPRGPRLRITTLSAAPLIAAALNKSR